MGGILASLRAASRYHGTALLVRDLFVQADVDDGFDDEYTPTAPKRRRRAVLDKPAVPALPDLFETQEDNSGSYSEDMLTALSSLENLATEAARQLHPSWLGSHDIVLTTYEALKNDIHHVDLSAAESRSMRNSKRYRVTPSPLLQMWWWRVVLDEAQLVENTLGPTADMAKRLIATNRCVFNFIQMILFVFLNVVFSATNLQLVCYWDADQDWLQRLARLVCVSRDGALL